MTYEELNRTLMVVASQVKLAVGIGNNAAWAAVLEAHDHIRQHRNYRHNVKRLYKQALQEFHDSEARLLHTQKNRMFRVADMSENTRKKYGDITDREYYDFWTAIGATAYAQTRPFVTNLHNKYRISLEAHGVRQPEILAWAMTADACLKIARQIYNVTLQVMEDVFKVRRKILIEVFGQFDLSRVIACWQTAMRQTDKGAFDYDMTDIERKNIQHAIDDLIDRWSDTQKHLRITNETMKDYDDIFRTKGELKKAQRELSELEQELKEDEDKRNYERRERKIKLAATADEGGNSDTTGKAELPSAVELVGC